MSENPFATTLVVLTVRAHSAQFFSPMRSCVTKKGEDWLFLVYCCLRFFAFSEDNCGCGDYCDDDDGYCCNVDFSA